MQGGFTRRRASVFERGGRHSEQGACSLHSVTHPPVRRRYPPHQLPLQIIGEAPARSGEEGGDLLIGMPSARTNNGVEDAPQNAKPLGGSFAFRRVGAADIGGEILMMCR